MEPPLICWTQPPIFSLDRQRSDATPSSLSVNTIVTAGCPSRWGTARVGGCTVRPGCAEQGIGWKMIVLADACWGTLGLLYNACCCWHKAAPVVCFAHQVQLQSFSARFVPTQFVGCCLLWFYSPAYYKNKNIIFIIKPVGLCGTNRMVSSKRSNIIVT